MAIKRIDDTRKITGIKAEADTYAEALAFLPHLEAGDQIRVVGGDLWAKSSIKTLIRVGGIQTKVIEAAPTVNDDISLGYVVGSLWYDTTATTGDYLYVCEDNADGAAVWKKSGVFS